jgi:hypothetical protein
VNGACLTVTEFGNDWFKVGLANETLKRTNLGESVGRSLLGSLGGSKADCICSIVTVRSV